MRNKIMLNKNRKSRVSLNLSRMRTHVKAIKVMRMILLWKSQPKLLTVA